MMKQGPGVCLEFEHLDSLSRPARSAFYSHSLAERGLWRQGSVSCYQALFLGASR